MTWISETFILANDVPLFLVFGNTVGVKKQVEDINVWSDFRKFKIFLFIRL